MADAPSLVLTIPATPVAGLQIAPTPSVGFQSVTAGVYSLNGVGGYVLFTGVDSIAVTQSGQSVIISGAIPTGFVSPGALESTGRQAWTAAQNNALNLSGALSATGAALGASIAALSGTAPIVTGLYSAGGGPIVLRATTGQVLEVLGNSASGIAPVTVNYSVPIQTTLFGGSGGLIGSPDGWLTILISGRVAGIPYYYKALP